MTKILVVDDSEDIQDVMAMFLGSLGYDVSLACDGADALRKLEVDEPPHLILLDWMMPVMDGREFLRRKVANPNLETVPLIVVTASHADLHMPSEVPVLRKPLALATLQRAVEGVCGPAR